MTAGRIEVSSQNHNFAVDPATLPAGVEVTHINLNDGTCAGGWMHDGHNMDTICTQMQGLGGGRETLSARMCTSFQQT
eukprot:scaffold318302_cov21-Tisochrysis_lutea.AAC.1